MVLRQYKLLFQKYKNDHVATKLLSRELYLELHNIEIFIED